MNKPITEAELAEWQRVTDAATEGPWDTRIHDGITMITHPHGWVMDSDDEEDDAADGDFIALARSAMPRLLEENARLVESNERLLARPIYCGCDHAPESQRE